MKIELNHDWLSNNEGRKAYKVLTVNMFCEHEKSCEKISIKESIMLGIANTQIVKKSMRQISHTDIEMNFYQLRVPLHNCK